MLFLGWLHDGLCTEEMLRMVQEACREALAGVGAPAKVLPAASDTDLEIVLRREILYANGSNGSVRSK